MIESILLSTVRISTFEGSAPRTNASGFFFERDERLFLVTSRHVMFDEPTKHFPDRLEIELHTDPDNIAETSGFSIPLYRERKSTWRQGKDSAGEIDVAAIEIDRAALPETAAIRCFTPSHLLGKQETIEPVIERFKTATPRRFPVAKGDVGLRGAIVDIDETTGKAVKIDRFSEDYSC